MPDIQLGACTVRSHGTQVARFHMYDWLILLLLVALDVGLNIIEPFHRFVGEDMMADLKYPLKGNTIPFWAVPIVAILLPVAVFIIYYFYRKDIYDLHGALLDAIKDAVGRPRPDFFWRCFPDGNGVFHNVTRSVVCHGNKVVIKEGHKSFPSGHTSWSFSGLGFLSWYLAGKLRAFDRRGHVAKLCIVVLPLLVAALVAVSRVDDYWHHWQDVFAGGLLGITVASFCYLQFFPAPNDIDGWGPHSYFQMLESRSSTQPSSSTANRQSAQLSEMDRIYLESRNVRGTAEFTRWDASPSLDAMEGERRY